MIPPELDWDFKCPRCGWCGLAEQADVDPDEEISLCPECGYEELQVNLG